MRSAAYGARGKEHWRSMLGRCGEPRRLASIPVVRDSRSGPVRLLLLALVCGSGCGSRIDPRSEPGAMFVNLSRAEGIELAVAEDALLGAAARCAARWR